MHPLQNGSQVDARPARKPTQGPLGYFSESNDNGSPSYPGQDFFNDQIEEFENALAAMGITFVPGQTDHLAKIFAAVKSTYPEYDNGTIYSYGDVVRREINGVYKLFEWYSNVESLAGKDPADTANRRPGWSDTTKPYYWKPYTTKLAGETMAWDDDNIPEIMMVGAGQQVSALTYHTLAAAKPQWIDGVDPNLLNIPDRQGRFTRAADGTTWLSGNTHEDQNKEHSHRIGGAVVDSANGSYPNSIFASATNGTPPFDSGYDQESNPSGGSEAMPKGYIEWIGYAL